MDLGRRRFLMSAAGLTALASAGTGWAQQYPARPITLVVPFAAGGPTDTLARILAERMKAALGQPVIIENVTGASGSIAVGRVVRAEPDGYTLSIGHLGSHVVNGAILPLSYDLLNDLAPVAHIANNPQVIVGRATLPANDLKELVAWLKANPDRATQGTSGAGSSSQLAGLYFQQQSGTRFRLVPYRGAAPAMQDLLGGQIDLMFDQASNALQHVRGGKVKAFGVTSEKRLAVAPDIPTVSEAGVPGFLMSVWHAVWVPRNTPRPIIAKLNDAIVESLADESVRAKLIELGQEIPQRDRQTPEALAALHRAEADKWWPIIKAAGVKPE